MLNNPVNLTAAKIGINKMLSQIPPKWDPHQRLEYLKMTIRSVIAGLVNRSRNELREQISELEQNLNNMLALEIKACALSLKANRNIMGYSF